MLAFINKVIKVINLLGPHQLVRQPPYATPALLQAVWRFNHCGAGPVTDHQLMLQPQPQLQLPFQQPQLPYQFQLLLQHQVEVVYQNHSHQSR